MVVSIANAMLDFAAVDEVQLAHEAQVRFERLLMLDERIPEREELRAAGVPSRTLISLYPYEFEALAGGLAELITGFEPRWATVTLWTDWVSRVERYERNFTWADREVQRSAAAAFSQAGTGQYVRLRKALLSVNCGGFSEAAADAMLMCLFEMCWFQAHAPELTSKSGMGLWQTHELFSAVIDWVLPGLIPQG